jgi:ketosteroid isomerase-like protein
MFQNVIRSLLPFLLAFAVVGSAAAAEINEAANQVIQQWQERFDAGDVEGVAALYAEDGMFVVTDPAAEFTVEDFEAEPVGESHEGRSAIGAAVGGFRDAGFRSVVFEPVDVIVTMGYAYSTGTYEFANGDDGRVRGQYLLVMTEQDGSWLIDRHVLTPLTPAE